MKIQVRTILLGLLSIGFVQSYAQTFALQVKNDQITYPNDDRGNRILDFSTCGYKSSEQDIPSVRNVVFVPWKAGDNTARIQRAIDYVASLARRFRFSGSRITRSGESFPCPAVFVSPHPELYCGERIKKKQYC